MKVDFPEEVGRHCNMVLLRCIRPVLQLLRGKEVLNVRPWREVDYKGTIDSWNRGATVLEDVDRRMVPIQHF